eukprot:scaffold31318_cov56-Skeletonema_dohrnii-CCMP3373.AAC.1
MGRAAGSRFVVFRGGESVTETRALGAECHSLWLESVAMSKALAHQTLCDRPPVSQKNRRSPQDQSASLAERRQQLQRVSAII